MESRANHLLVGSFVLGLSMESITAWLIFALWIMAAGVWLPNILQVVWWRFNSWGYLSSWIANLGLSWLVVWVLPAMNVTLNMLSLFAFIVTLGIIVDDAIVVGERIYAHERDDESQLESRVMGCREHHLASRVGHEPPSGLPLHAVLYEKRTGGSMLVLNSTSSRPLRAFLVRASRRSTRSCDSSCQIVISMPSGTHPRAS